MTRFEKLSTELQCLWNEHAEEIKALPRTGPKGGHNACNISGWLRCPHQTITKAAHHYGLATMRYWDGPAPTPSTAIPACVRYEAEKAYKRIYKEDIV